MSQELSLWLRKLGILLWGCACLLGPLQAEEAIDRTRVEDELKKLSLTNVTVDLNVRIDVPLEHNPHATAVRTIWASLFLPPHAAHEKLPTIIVSTAYRRELIAALQLPLLRHGYALLGIDSYGTGSTSGDWDALGLREQYDIKYVIDQWLPSQSWADGKVGMIGPSYMGLTQLLVAGLVDRDPVTGSAKHLKAIMPLGAGSDLYQEATMAGGTLGLAFRLGWVGFTQAFALFPPTLFLGEHRFPSWKDIHESFAIWKNHLQNFLKYFEMALGNTRYLKHSEWYAERSPMSYWPIKPKEPWAFREALRSIPKDLAVFSVGGWFDIFTRGTLNNYQYGLSQTPTTHKALIMGEWYHFSTAFSFGAWPLQTSEVASRWFDIHLRGKRDSFVEKFPVMLWVMGENRWRAEKSWPLPPERLEHKQLFLSKQRASAIPGDWYSKHERNQDLQFALKFEADDEAMGPDPVMRHQGNPLSWHGLISRSHARWLAGAWSLPGELAELAKLREREQMIFEDERFDEVGDLTFTSEPLTDDLEIVGPIYMRFWAKTEFNEPKSSLARWAHQELKKLWDRLPSSMVKEQMGERDVQWVVELNDVFPEGRARNVSSGWLRASRRPYDESEARERLDPAYKPGDPFYRRSLEQPQPIEEGQIYEYVVELWPTLNRFKKGHRIRLSVTGSDFPHLLPILTGSENTLVIDREHPARLEFQVTQARGEGESWHWIQDLSAHLKAVAR